MYINTYIYIQYLYISTRNDNSSRHPVLTITFHMAISPAGPLDIVHADIDPAAQAIAEPGAEDQVPTQLA